MKRDKFPISPSFFSVVRALVRALVRAHSEGIAVIEFKQFTKLDFVTTIIIRSSIQYSFKTDALRLVSKCSQGQTLFHRVWKEYSQYACSESIAVICSCSWKWYQQKRPRFVKFDKCSRYFVDWTRNWLLRDTIIAIYTFSMIFLGLLCWPSLDGPCKDWRSDDVCSYI